MELDWLRPAAFFGSILYALIGVIIFWLCFLIVDKITPYDLWREIVEKQNRALGMVVAAMCLGISIIVAAAIHGGCGSAACAAPGAAAQPAHRDRPTPASGGFAAAELRLDRGHQSVGPFSRGVGDGRTGEHPVGCEWFCLREPTNPTAVAPVICTK